MAENESKDVEPVLQPEPDQPLPPIPDTETPPVIAQEPDRSGMERPESSVMDADTTPPAKSRSGGFGRFLGILLGGVAVAGLGYGLAVYGTQQGWTLPMLQKPASAAELSALHQQVETLTARLTELEARPAPAPAAAPDLTPLEDRIAALEARPVTEAGPAVDLAPLQQRLNALEAEVSNLQPTDDAAIQSEIAAQIASRMDAVKAEAGALTAEAERRAAVIGLQAALTSGHGVTEAQAALEATGIPLPEPVTAYLADPVSLAGLQASFPDAARAALADARSAARADGSVTDRMAVFLLNQTGARSATPREGDDPDAVLSRAEAALAAGDLAAVMPLLSGLPEAAQPALADWQAQAGRLIAAQAALAQLTSAD
ncbi:COG4223 family protein [Gemmobacter serpentinus]|uniref:COG4223 family protein n=1 Tax=Gemmobacter serpentinus TaxID=2652247 RepID=UPI00124DB401|nr:hypothetical protein [Gemmobacter serpentinus]